jgi:hypothetical protein
MRCRALDDSTGVSEPAAAVGGPPVPPSSAALALDATGVEPWLGATGGRWGRDRRCGPPGTSFSPHVRGRPEKNPAGDGGACMQGQAVKHKHHADGGLCVESKVRVWLLGWTVRGMWGVTGLAYSAAWHTRRRHLDKHTGTMVATGKWKRRGCHNTHRSHAHPPMTSSPSFQLSWGRGWRRWQPSPAVPLVAGTRPRGGGCLGRGLGLPPL